MAKDNKLGDFGLPRHPKHKTQIVGIFDLVGFTKLDSNEDLVQAVFTMENQMTFVLSPQYYWDERDRKGDEKSTNNILLRSTGDGYIVGFSEGIDDLEVLEDLTKIHNNIRKHHPVRLGINKGQNFVVRDLNRRVNTIGWGINLAARALQFATKNQIICTEYFAKSIVETHGPKVSKYLQDAGKRKIKQVGLGLFNYYKKGEFGKPLTRQQKQKKQ